MRVPMRLVGAILLAGIVACGGGGDGGKTPANTQPTPTEPTAPETPVTPDGVPYMNRMLDIMQANSINRKTIDWVSFRAQVIAAVSNADPLASVRLALTLLGDHHSFYIKTDGTAVLGSPLVCTAPSVPAVEPNGGDIGYVRVPSFSGTTAQALALADLLQGTIRSTDGQGMRGWIVDLRGNGGGSMFPMIAGVGPILGAGTAGFFIDANSVSSPWGYTGTAAITGGFIAQPVTSPYTLITPNPRVAVLTDQRVASSGEGVAVAFRGRPNTRVFGTATCGLSSGNVVYPLSDGAQLVLTTAIMVDRTGRVYGIPLEPDEVITDVNQVLTRATAWLRTP